ncbi:MAG TPA: hypothetical protein EYP22_01085, partial [Methanosarcinales archaeon]|nr:hypothetical protein [Methanosarcinales archaeon]
SKDDLYVRADAAEALGKIRDNRAIGALIKSLLSGEILSEDAILSKDAIDTLNMAFYQDNNEYVRVMAKELLHTALPWKCRVRNTLYQKL